MQLAKDQDCRMTRIESENKTKIYFPETKTDIIKRAFTKKIYTTCAFAETSPRLSAIAKLR